MSGERVPLIRTMLRRRVQQIRLLGHARGVSSRATISPSCDWSFGCHMAWKNSTAAPTTSIESAMLKLGQRNASLHWKRIQSRTRWPEGASAVRQSRPDTLGQAEAIVEISQDAGGHAAERGGQPNVTRGGKPEQPDENGHASDNAHRGEEPGQPFAHPEQCAGIAAQLDADTARPKPVDGAAGKLWPRKDPGLGGEIGRASDGGNQSENEIAVAWHARHRKSS